MGFNSGFKGLKWISKKQVVIAWTDFTQH